MNKWFHGVDKLLNICYSSKLQYEVAYKKRNYSHIQGRNIMKQVLFTTMLIVASFFIANTTVQAADDVLLLSAEGQVHVKTYMAKGDARMSISFDYMFGNEKQQKAFQSVFNDIYTGLEQAGWSKSFDDDTTYYIDCTYNEDGVIKFIYIGRDWADGGNALTVYYEDQGDYVKAVLSRLNKLEVATGPGTVKYK